MDTCACKVVSKPSSSSAPHPHSLHFHHFFPPPHFDYSLILSLDFLPPILPFLFVTNCYATWNVVGNNSDSRVVPLIPFFKPFVIYLIHILWWKKQKNMLSVSNFWNEKQCFLYFFLKWAKFCFFFDICTFLGEFIYLDAVLFLYSFIKDKLICVLQDMFPGLVVKLKFCLLKKLPGSLIFWEDKQLVFYLIQYLFWMWPSVKTFANPWDSSVLAESTLFLPKELYLKKKKNWRDISMSNGLHMHSLVVEI